MSHDPRTNAATPRRMRGVVLLSILLVVALLSAVAWQLVGRHSLVIAQARFTYVGDQTMEYALGAEAFARQVLWEDLQTSPNKDTLLEPWAQAAPPFELDDGYLEIQVRDLGSCFNLNSLADPTPANAEKNLERLKVLLRSRNVPENLAEVWRDWVDMDEEVNGFGAEDGEYLLAEPAYRTANVLAVDVSEFRLIEGVEPEHIEALGDSVCVVPNTGLAININTASAAVLASLDPLQSEAALEPFVESERDYENAAEAANDMQELAAIAGVAQTTSEYFEVNIRARVDDGQTELSSLLWRNPDGGQITLLRRNFGRDFRSLFAQTPTQS